ncbi:MAG TPA: DUF1573 domain-containing protein, partial [Candidatus Binataceae bacterium]|nr:DUF1573 domain-containing protein [Candidatus Binataceae bacterium]
MILFTAAFCATVALVLWPPPRAGADLVQSPDASSAAKKKSAGKIAVKPKSLRFGKVTHTVILQFNIQNTGTAPITGSIASTGNTPFAIISGTSSFGPLNPGGLYAVTVQFAPRKKGSYASAITIVSNAKNAKVKVTMSGSA